MSINEVGKAYVTIEVNNKKVEQQFDQTKQKLTKTSTAIHQNFNKSFNQISQSAQRTASKISSIMKLAMAPMLAGGGMAIKKFMESAGGENAKRSWQATKKELDASLARIGGMIWSSKIFGKTIEGWTKELTKFLSQLKEEQIQRMISTFELLAKALAGIKIGTFILGLASAVDKLALSLGALTAVAGAKGIAGAVGASGAGSLYDLSDRSKVRPVKGKSMAFIKNELSMAKTHMAVGSSYIAQALFGKHIPKDLRPAGVRAGGKFMGAGVTNLANIARLPITGKLASAGKLSAITAFFAIFLSFLNGMSKIGGSSSAIKQLGESLSWLMDKFAVFFKAIDYWGQRFMYWASGIKETRTPEEQQKDLDAMAMGTYGKGTATGTDTSAPQSETQASSFKETFDALIAGRKSTVEQFAKDRDKLISKINSASTIEEKNDATKNLSEFIEKFSDKTESFNQNMQDFKTKLGDTLADDKISKDSKAFEALDIYMRDGETSSERFTDMVLSASGNILEAIEKANDEQEKAIKKAKEIKEKVSKANEYIYEARESRLDMQKKFEEQAVSMANKFNEVKKTMSEGLGYSGGTMDITQGANFAAQVQFDWNKKLYDVNKQIADLMKEDKEEQIKLRTEKRALDKSLKVALDKLNESLK